MEKEEGKENVYKFTMMSNVGKMMMAWSTSSGRHRPENWIELLISNSDFLIDWLPFQKNAAA